MNNIKKLRTNSKMTQEDLAKKLNVKRSVISKYENGNIPLTDTLINQMTSIFGVSADYLLGNTDNKNPKKASSGIKTEEALMIAIKNMLGREPTEEELRKFLDMTKVFFDVKD